MCAQAERMKHSTSGCPVERPAASARFGVADRSRRVVVGESDLGADGADLPCEVRATSPGRRQARSRRPSAARRPTRLVGRARRSAPPETSGSARPSRHARRLALPRPGRRRRRPSRQGSGMRPTGRCALWRARRARRLGRDLDAQSEILEPVPIAMLYTCRSEHCQRLAQGFRRAQLLGRCARLQPEFDAALVVTRFEGLPRSAHHEPTAQPAGR